MRLHRLVASGLVLAGLAAAVPHATAAPRDPLYAKQWGPQQVRAEQAWAKSRGRGVIIAIVDSGIDLDHPDLRSKVIAGATFLGCSTISGSCGNGDWESGPAARRATKSPHGTHVAGTAAAATGNGIGIAGVAPDAKLLAVKVLDEDGGSFGDIAKGIRYSVSRGAKVINLSLGALPGVQALTFTGLISDVQQAVTYAASKGVVVVAAAGNDFVSPLCGTPAFDAGALCVTATDRREAPAAYSNSGIKPDLLSVAGPGGSVLPICGEDVVSTVPPGTGRSSVCGYGTAYDEFAGTSMASPHVAGVAALLVAQRRTRLGVLKALTSTARTPGVGLRGVWNPEYGYGIVDAAAAVATPRS